MISSKISLIIVILIIYIFSEKVCHADHTEFIAVNQTNIEFFSNGTASTTMDVGLYTMTAAAFDHTKKDIYVCDLFKKFYRIKINGKTEYSATELTIDKKDVIVMSIAFDHKHSTLYWRTCYGIFYVSVPDKITVQLIRQDLLTFDENYSPDGLAISVHRSYLYWVSFNNETKKMAIEGSKLDRSERKTLVKELIDPKGITVDADGNTLYWIKRNEDDRSIVSLDLQDNGTPHTLVHIKEERRPDVIAVDDHNVYWIEYASNNFWVMPKDSSNLQMQATSKMKLKNMPIGLFVLPGGYGSKEGYENKLNDLVTSDGSMASRFFNHSYYRTHGVRNHN